MMAMASVWCAPMTTPARLHTVILNASETGQLDGLELRAKEISSASFEEIFAQMSDRGCTELLRFRREVVLRLGERWRGRRTR